MAKLPLEGIRVVEINIIWAGPFARKLLADMGAEVIHLDPISHRPDFGRQFNAWPTRAQLEARDVSVFPNSDPGTHPWNRNAGYNRYFWNVRSCSIDLRTPEGKEVFKRLIAKTDVFIENGSAVAMEHIDLGHEVLMEINPRLICINMPSYGRSGEYKDYVGWGDNAEAVAGQHAEDAHVVRFAAVGDVQQVLVRREA